MIGYSDSGKDAGRLAAAWALFEAQEKLVRETQYLYRYMIQCQPGCIHTTHVYVWLAVLMTGSSLW